MVLLVFGDMAFVCCAHARPARQEPEKGVASAERLLLALGRCPERGRLTWSVAFAFITRARGERSR
eukprot:2117576-Lingulodinium_polyedra.AAC.1